MKIVFMGTPQFAATILKSLDENGHEIVCVYTQPDRPKGRSGKPVPSEVKEYALLRNIPVFQPEKIKEVSEVERLKSIDADVFVVAAFGQFLSEEILNIPKYGCINVHGSLLPAYRGAAPIQRSIMNGDMVTGVTVMRMDKGMDSGDIISETEVEITEEDNETTMYEKLAKEGADLLVATLPEIENNTAVYTTQDPEFVSFAPSLKKEEGRLDFNKTAWQLDCMVRGMSEWPVAYTYYDKKMLKVYSAKAVMPEDDEYGLFSEELLSMNPGTFIITKKDVFIVTGEGVLKLLEVQLEGKKRMPAIDCQRGIHIETGMCVD